MLQISGHQPLVLPPRSPNLNPFAERWVRSIKQECLSKLILVGEGSLRRAPNEFIEHYHLGRNHQSKQPTMVQKTLKCRQRLGGLLNYYSRAA